MWRNLLRSGLIVGGGVLLGRLAGFAREVLLAHALGLGRAADLAVFAMTLPDFVTGLLVGGAGGGAVIAVLVPEFKRLQEREPGRERALLRHATLLSFAVFALLVGALAAGGTAVVSLLAPGLPPADRPEAARLMSIAGAAIPFFAMAVVSIACLKAHQRFLVPSLGPVFYNLVIIVAIAIWTRPDALLPLAAGVVAGMAAYWLAQGVAIAFLPRPPAAPEAGWSVSRGLLGRYVHALGSFGIAVLVPVIARALASLDSPGSLAAVNYAQKMVELPMAAAVGVLSMVLLPRFSELFVRNQEAEAATLARQGSWLVWTLSLPIAMAMAWFSGPLVSLLLGHGAMRPEDTRRIAELSAWALLAVPALGQSSLFFSILSARGDTKRPFRAGILLFAAYLGGAWAGLRHFGLPGLVLAGVLLHWSLAATYAGLLSRHHGIRIFTGGLARDFLLAAVAAGAGLAPFALLGGRDLPPVGGTALALGAGAVSLGVALLLFPRYKTLPRGLRTFYDRGRQ